MSVRYRRLNVNDENCEEEVKKQRAERIDYIQAKIHALFWVGTAVAIIYFTDLINVALNDTRAYRSCGDRSASIVCSELHQNRFDG